MSQNPNSVTGQALDRADARVRQDEGLGGALRAFGDRVRSGDLGMIPVAVGLVLIAVVFTTLNPVFLRPGNVSNLLYDCATTGIISLGIVCVLLLGEIDLSVGSMSGLASAMLGVLWINNGWPLVGAVAVALGFGASSAHSTPRSTTASACRPSWRRSPASSRCSGSSSTSSAHPARSTCPSTSPSCASARTPTCRTGCRWRWPSCRARWCSGAGSRRARGVRRRGSPARRSASSSPRPWC